MPNVRRSPCSRTLCIQFTASSHSWARRTSCKDGQIVLALRVALLCGERSIRPPRYPGDASTLKYISPGNPGYDRLS